MFFQRYIELGVPEDKVHMLGKPHPLIYAIAKNQYCCVGSGTSHAKVVAVGDSLAHDIMGGINSGCATVFITSGIHSKELHREGGSLDRSALDELLKEHTNNEKPTLVSLNFE